MLTLLLFPYSWFKQDQKSAKDGFQWIPAENLFVTNFFHQTHLCCHNQIFSTCLGFYGERKRQREEEEDKEVKTTTYSRWFLSKTLSNWWVSFDWWWVWTCAWILHVFFLCFVCWGERGRRRGRLRLVGVASSYLVFIGFENGRPRYERAEWTAMIKLEKRKNGPKRRRSTIREVLTPFSHIVPVRSGWRNVDSEKLWKS